MIKQPDGSIAVYKYGKLALYIEEETHPSEEALDRMAKKIINDFNNYVKDGNIS